MIKPQVSVVIPCYNGAQFVDTALQAVFNSTFSDFEVVFVDDGSTDGTKGILEEKGWLKRVRYVYQENKGLPAARNVGIRNAQGQFISLLDIDDRPLPDRLERLVSYLESHPEFKMVYSPCFMEYADRDEKRYVQDVYSSHTPRWLPKRYEGDLFENLFYLRIFPSSALLCKEAALSIGLFDESLKVCEDLEFFFNFGAQYEIGFVENPCWVRVVHHATISKERAELFPHYLMLVYNRYYQTLKKRSSRGEKIYRERMASACWGLAKVLLQKGDRKGAKKKAVDAIRMNPYRSKYYFNIYTFWL
jgi:glycosyltransferase involved in cell wall biosynthesis